MVSRGARSWATSLATMLALAALAAVLLRWWRPDVAAPADEGRSEESCDLVFEDVEVTCSGSDGLLGDGYATFEVTARLRCDAGREVGAEDMPVLVSSGPDGVAYECALDPETLGAGATGTVSFKGAFDLSHETIPVLAFSCKLGCAGLEDAQERLNAGLATIVATYARVEDDGEEGAEAAERARQDGERAMRDSVGSPAHVGLSAAQAAGYSPTFKDCQGADVTSRVRDDEDDSGVRDATITQVDVSRGHILDSVSFTLDYTDPDIAREREAAAAKAEADERARAEAEAAGTLARDAGEDVAVTAEDNDDFARLLAVADPEDPLVARFANGYQGRSVAFDARVVGVTGRGAARVDLVIVAHAGEGASDARADTGPTFSLRGVSLDTLGLEDANTVEVGTLLHVTARIVGLADENSRIVLAPVEVSLA